MANRKNLMDGIASKVGIKRPSDWGQVTIQQVHQLGGGTLLNKYYNGSLFTCLESVYKGFSTHLLYFLIYIDIKWERKWFRNRPNVPKNYWKSMENQKKFMDELAIKLNIKDPRDWGKQTTRVIYELGKGSLLNGYYNNSVFSCLQAVYKGFYI